MYPSNNILQSHPIYWDAHGCPPFKIGADLSFLKRYKKSGVNFVSLNVGFDLTSKNETLKIINYFHQWILKNSHEFMIIETTQQIIECQSKNKLSIAFDIEGCNLLSDNLEMIAKLYSLGVKQMTFTYNTNNALGCGCLDKDTGLTKFGRQVVKACNDVGMLIDCSHASYRTSMEIMELSNYPIIFSHSNPAKLVDHPRNILDEQIIRCAEKGGVIGINGIGIFLGNNDVRTERIAEHIDYVAQKVGVNHVGIGLDCVFDQDEIKSYVKNSPATFPKKYHFDDVAIAQPEQFSEIGNFLKKRGYSCTNINNILGENFLRVAESVWK